jgi:tetratricopeptide (TPR) repeat protein
MSKESLAFAVSGTLFGFLVGWMVGSQATRQLPSTAPAPVQASTAQQQQSPQAPPLDAQRAADLERQATGQPTNAAVRLELANLYFDAERFDQAIPWYENALKLTPNDVNASTDLAVCYYYTNQIDRSLAQLDRSLKIDPKHAKSLLNRGIVLAFGKNDLDAAKRAWDQVIAIAPGSPEALRAQQGIDGITSSHGGSARGRGGEE